MIELEKSKSGNLTLKYNNKYIHSKYDPVKEGIQFAEGNKELLNEKKSLRMIQFYMFLNIMKNLLNTARRLIRIYLIIKIQKL